MKKVLHITFMFALCITSFSGLIQAQQPQATEKTSVVASAQQETAENIPTAYFQQSLFFSPAEETLIRRAMQGTVSGTKALEATAGKIIPERRIISLAGVIYRKPQDWVVWLNGQKLTPDRLMPEIVDIEVEREQVHLKWFDIGINDIIAITLRPHQTYDIVTGVLLPGVSR